MRLCGFYPVGVGCKLIALKVRELIRLIESDGWRHVRTTGSHRHFKHLAKPHVVTVPGSPGDDIPAGTLKAILRSAGLEEKK
ncbi:MAG: type II toxin-antitoxin system HicA family toxin [Acidobacteriota bacterium]